ncbi:MAG: SRPBCC family protein [Solirubrobacteraceae bacterium]
MSGIRASIDIAAPPPHVWALLMDPSRLGEWVTIHHALREAPNGELGLGSHLTQTLRLRGANFTVRWKVVEFDAPSRAVWEGRGPARSRARITYELWPTEHGTRFDYVNEFHPPGGPLGAVAGRVLVGGITRHEANASLRRLAALAET